MSTDFHRVLIEQAPDALIASSPAGTVLFWNEAAEELFGYSSPEAMGHRLEDLIAPHQESLNSPSLKRHRPPNEIICRAKNGTLLYIHCCDRAAADPVTGERFTISQMRDITQKNIERHARAIERRYGDLLESMPDALVIVNGLGHIVQVNSQAESLFEYERGQLLGSSLEMLLPERLREAHVQHRLGFFSQLRKRAMGAGLELFGQRSSGQEFPVEISLSPLEGDEEPLVMSAIRDITERKRFEQMLYEKNLELQKASKAKDRFLAGMSHELRTPLNAIIGFTGTLLLKLPGPLTADQEKQLETIKSSSKHLLSLINDLLDLAKIESETIVLNPEPVHCGHLLSTIIDSLRPLAENQSLILEVEIPAEDVILRTDKRALNQILLNLASNAIKFTDEGKVRLQLCPPPDREGAVEFVIEDTGIGIREEDVSRLFQAFTRLQEDTRCIEGSGMGLYLSQKLANFLGGEITYQGLPEGGSRFQLTLRDLEEQNSQ